MTAFLCRDIAFEKLILVASFLKFVLISRINYSLEHIFVKNSVFYRKRANLSGGPASRPCALAQWSLSAMAGPEAVLCHRLTRAFLLPQERV
jgi:hypothetical protein